MMAASNNKVFSIFADDRNDHAKMVKQLLSNQVPPIQKTKPMPHRPVSANPNMLVNKAPPTKTKANKLASNPVKDDANKVSR